MVDARPDEILTFWFSPEVSPKWYEKNAEFDALIREKYLAVYEDARNRLLESWIETKESALALIIVLDQFPRNMFRGKAQAFATDPLALMYARIAIKRGYTADKGDIKMHFFYLPFMHAEDLNVLKEGEPLYVELGIDEETRYLREHMDIVARFGRFPHRNAALGRESTADEIAFMAVHKGF